MPTTSCKQTWTIDDVMWTDMNFALGNMQNIQLLCVYRIEDEELELI